tara:strand:+ start:110 stop:769 length:660 start_codon:yes stop_codon:yes gene_type:complete
MIIAIDGPAASGKSTAAKGVAKCLGITYLDTGAMYRAVTFGLIKNNISFTGFIELKKYVDNMNLEFKYNQAGSMVFLNGEDISKEIRSQVVTNNVSEVSAMSYIRNSMVNIQREISSSKDCVVEGRDIGTVVFPKANFKFFLIADVETRAKRRLKDLTGNDKNISIEKLINDINIRDYKDTKRVNSPLEKADDAIEINTTDLTINEIINKIVNIVNKGH